MTKCDLFLQAAQAYREKPRDRNHARILLVTAEDYLKTRTEAEAEKFAAMIGPALAKGICEPGQRNARYRRVICTKLVDLAEEFDPRTLIDRTRGLQL